MEKGKRDMEREIEGEMERERQGREALLYAHIGNHNFTSVAPEFCL